MAITAIGQHAPLRLVAVHLHLLVGHLTHAL
jgi:hypothetical protein